MNPFQVNAVWKGVCSEYGCEIFDMILHITDKESEKVKGEVSLFYFAVFSRSFYPNRYFGLGMFIPDSRVQLLMVFFILKSIK